MFEKEELDVIVFDKFFSVEVPKGWEFDEEEGIISFYKDSGGGKLQVCFFERSEMGLPTLDEIKDLALGFAENIGLDVGVDDLMMTGIDENDSAYFVSKKDGATWHVWVVTSEHKTAPMLYISDGSDNDEFDVIEFIVNSFKWEYDDSLESKPKDKGSNLIN